MRMGRTLLATGLLGVGLLGVGLLGVGLLSVGHFRAGLLMTPAFAADRTCTQNDIADAVDQTGAVLRKINAETYPQLQAKMRQLKDVKGWTETDYQEQSMVLLQDARTEQLDVQSSDILSRLDAIGSERVDAATACTRLDELSGLTTELAVVLKAKSSYAMSRLDALIQESQPDKGTGKQAALAPPVSPPAVPASPPSQRTPPPVRAEPPLGVAVPPPSAWTTTTEAEQTAAMVAPGAGDADGYSIDEIREATRGFFGQISTGLASVIEHAFRKSGRPVAYVLGNEGGGAFLAGLRYGKGTLFIRRGETRDVYWHGPSIGTDFGLSGSKTMFLIYKLEKPEDLFARFTGIDGSAYFVGGVGLTFLTDGHVVMAPIRSGLGFRVGANLGYVSFTATQTWNPF